MRLLNIFYSYNHLHIYFYKLKMFSSYKIIYLAIKCVVITILHQPPTFTSESNINFIPNK